MRSRLSQSLVISLCLGLISVLSISAARVPREDAVKLPQNMIMRVELLSSINTKDNKEGDKFTARVLAPEQYHNAIVEGHITKLKPAAHAGESSELSLAFDTITLDKGQGASGKMVAQIQAVYDVEDSGKVDEEGKVKGKSLKKRNAVKVGAGAGTGAVIGGLLGGGKGAAIGAGVGAAVGATTVLAGKGKDMEFPTGTVMDIKTGGKG